MIFVATWAEALPLIEFRPRVSGIGCRSYALAGCQAVLSAGFAGACRPEIVAGDVVLSGDVPAFLRSALGAIDGQLRTLSHLASPREKAELTKDGVVAVDMETEHIAAAAAKQGIPFLGVRAIVDRLQDSPLGPAVILRYPVASRRLRWAVRETMKVWPSTAAGVTT